MGAALRCVLFSVLLLGCATGTRPDVPCTTDLDCSGGRCLDGRCAATDGAPGPSGQDAGPAGRDAGPMCVDATECDDADACTMDSCVAGSCSHPPVTCDDGDACTMDACDAASGCTSVPRSCDDGDACTTDSCDAASGCENARIAVPGGTCASAIDVTAGGTFSGDSSCASSDYAGICGGGEGGDVTFVFELAARSTVELDASGTAFSPVLFVGATCGDESGGCDGAGQLTAELAPGRYYVGLDGRASSDVGAWSLQVSITPVPRDETVIFPAAGDTRVTVYPNLWHAGDYVQGTRATSLPSITSAQMNLAVSNSLSCDTQDMRALINGVEIGRFSIAPGASTVSRTFSFSAISGPSYTLRVETVRTVGDGCGSAGLPNDMSTFRLAN